MTPSSHITVYARARIRPNTQKASQGVTPLRPTYLIRLRPLPNVDAIRALRAALKVLLRRFGLKAIEVRICERSQNSEEESRK